MLIRVTSKNTICLSAREKLDCKENRLEDFMGCFVYIQLVGDFSYLLPARILVVVHCRKGSGDLFAFILKGGGIVSESHQRRCVYD
jgi:hypothetical protein